MNQQINLYQAPFRDNLQRLSAKTLLQGTAAFVAVLLIMAALHGWQIIRLQHQVTFLENQYSFLNTEYSDLEHKMTAGKVDPTLAQQVKKMENTLNSQQQLQSLLNDDLFNSGQGYSRYLIALARQHIAGLWLTSIILNGAGHDIALQGQTTRADLLPRYLQNLSHESQLQGLELQIFHLNRNMDKKKLHYTGTFGFMVATTDTGGNKQ